MNSINNVKTNSAKTNVIDLIKIYNQQLVHSIQCATGHEEHHTNGPRHDNNPGTGWYHSHNNGPNGTEWENRVNDPWRR